ncbi:c-type cytochrome biogenesis protein CcsB [Proteinivorax hydrogeniformans]|uniref:C-type cytochrome biogenesis protein CcsB n=1 Tax=Proteinivorax hydrogeniformans TaxID=1826727 RepID=A0AAU8HV91_9FIRM
MIERILFNISFFGYGLTVVLYMIFMFKQNIKIAKLGFFTIATSWVIHTISLLLRWYAAGYPPLTNQFEFASSFAWGIALCYIFIYQKYRYHGLGIFITPVIFMIAGYGMSLSRDISPLMPALQSNWLFFHVFTAVLSYGAFGVAFGLGILFIVMNKLKDGKDITRHLPKLEKIDSLIYKTIAFGFLFLTLVIVTGAVWAQEAWTRYWAWDPKETWSLITWIIYAIFLHARLKKGLKGQKLAMFAIIGFASVLFTYMGVNMLLPSIHSYM